MNTPIYRIKDWDRIFENNRTRELRQMTWVPIPNKHDGDGYSALAAHENAAAIYGAWVAILQVASKCDPRGTLVRGSIPQEGAEVRIPHDAASISRMCRLPASDIQKALMVCQKECNWLEIIGFYSIPQEDAVIPQEDAPRARARREGKGRERREGMEEEGIAGAPPSSLDGDANSGSKSELRPPEVNPPIPRRPPSAMKIITIPEKLQDAAFVAAWEKWMVCRRGQKAPKDWFLFFSNQLEMLAEFTPQQAVNILRMSTLNNYVGLFPKYANEGFSPNDRNPPGPFNGRSGNQRNHNTEAPNEQAIAGRDQLRQRLIDSDAAERAAMDGEVPI